MWWIYNLFDWVQLDLHRAYLHNICIITIQSIFNIVCQTFFVYSASVLILSCMDLTLKITKEKILFWQALHSVDSMWLNYYLEIVIFGACKKLTLLSKVTLFLMTLCIPSVVPEVVQLFLFDTKSNQTLVFIST